MQSILVFVLYFLFLEREVILGYIKLSMEKVSNEEERLLLTLAWVVCWAFFPFLSTTLTLCMVTETKLFLEAWWKDKNNLKQSLHQIHSQLMCRTLAKRSSGVPGEERFVYNILLQGLGESEINWHLHASGGWEYFTE